MLKYKENLKAYARELRSNQTDCEKKLWHGLRRKQVLGIQFYRQKPIGEYIVDFYAPKARIVIEVDGGQHFLEEEQKKDSARDLFLTAQGLTVLRFHNREVIESLEGILKKIFLTVEGRIRNQIPPDPPFSKGGEKSGSEA